MAVATTAAAAAAGGFASGSSLGASGNHAWNPSRCSSRQHFPFPDVAMSVWPSAMHSVVRSGNRQGRGSSRCQCQGVEEDPERNQVAEDDLLLNMKSVSSKNLEEYIDSCKASTSEDTDWKLWQEYFPKVEEEDNLISALKFQLEEAVNSEDFQEAAKLKKAIEAAKSNDVISEVNKELQRALQEERYNDAARLRDEGAAGLVGWWAGISKDGDDPFGRIINVKAAHGRLVARNYSARQLAITAQRSAQGGATLRAVQGTAQGNALFEVFVKKDDKLKGFNKQVVYLQRETTQADLDKLVELEVDEIVTEAERSTEDSKTSTQPEKSTQVERKDDEKTAEAYREASSIVDFLKERIPDFNMKVIKVIAPEGTEPDIPKIIEEIIEKEQKEQQQGEDETVVGGVIIDDSSDTAKQADDKRAEAEKAVTIRVVIGGASPSDGADGSVSPAVRIPATINQETKDSFVLHIDSILEAKEPDDGKFAEVAAKLSADQMPEDVAQKLWNVGKVPIQVSNELKEVIKLAVNQAQGMRSLSKTTVFQRIDVTESADPLSGLYVGAFGANTPEIIQLKRKYGHWDTQKAKSENKLKFYEYVEGVKLTGDMNVPAGQVSFRARIGKDNKQSPVGVYPEELGVVARYRGQGQLADPGYKNPKWTDGELVLLDGRKSGPANGAKLGFVFYLPDHHFLILFDRLNLEEV